MRRLAKLGYAVKGVVYGVMAVLALQVAFGVGGELAGEREAVEHIGRQPFGSALLVIIGVGLLGYALWRVVEAIVDPQRSGTGWKGIAFRVAALGSAIINGAVGVAALRLAFGQGGQGGGAKAHTASLLDEPWGLALIAFIGVFVIGVAVYQFHSAHREKFLEHLSLRRLSPKQVTWVRWSGKVGLIARGVVFAIIGVALVQTAVSTDPGQAKGAKEALSHLAAQPFGQVLLTVVAAGLLAYAVYLVTTVRYRRIEY